MSFLNLNVAENVLIDESIANFEYHTHQPYASTTYKCSDEIRIPIQTQDLYTLPSYSYIYIEGKLLKNSDDVKHPPETTHIKFIKNGISFLFDEIRYEIGGTVIDQTRNLGITSTLKSYLSYTKNQFDRLQNAGLALDGLPDILDQKGNFTVCIPLKLWLGFAEDFQKVIMNVRQELVLIRSSNDLNAIINQPVTGTEKPFVEINKIYWKVPHLKVADVQKLRLLKYVEESRDLSISFRNWEIQQLPTLQETTHHTWTVKSSSLMEKPRIVIFAFQTDRKNSLNRDSALFDHCNLRNIKLFLNADAYPYDNLNLDWDKNQWSLLYEMYAHFQRAYYYKNEAEPAFTPSSFRHTAPIAVIDCTHQSETIKNGAVDIRLEIETAKPVLRGNSSDACETRDPCQHGGICISTDSGPICECRNPDFEGEFCEKDKAPSEAVFRGTEFLSYDLTQTGGEPIVSAQDSVTFHFKTRQPNGLLFYTGDATDYLNVAIKDGCLSLTMGLANGKQDMQIKPNKVRFDDNQWHKVSVHRRIQEISAITSFCRLSAVVDGVYADHSHIAGKFTMLLSSKLHVGGSINTRALPGSRVHNNFVGCMRKVEFVADTLRLNLLELGRSGSHLISVVGRLDYKCPAGETHDPITFTTRESHLILPPWNAKKTGNISFKFRTNEANGLILFNGGVRPPRVDLFSLEIYNGHIYIHLDLGSGAVKQRGSRRRIDDGSWHEVSFRRNGRDARITVDGFHTDFKTPEGSTSLELDGNMYVGGLGPPFSEIPISVGLWTAVLQQGFVGCFKDLTMNNEPVDVASYAREQDSASIRTLCHTQPPQCVSQPCLNGGVCNEGWNRFICDCTNTIFTGPTCGKEAATLSFNGTQHMEVNMDSEQVTQTEDIVLRFRTSKPLGLLLITSTVETGDRIELAVAAGRIRMALRLGVKDKKDEDKEKDKILLAGQNVNDNEWHTMRFSRRGANLKLQLDNHLPIRAETQGKHNTLQWRTIHIGGLYHLEEEISMTTTVPNFIGELQQFYFNNIPYIELARASRGEQSIAGFPGIRVAARFVKHATDNLHRPVTFRSRHTFIGLPMLRAYSSIHIDFMFRTREANGLIMFNGGRKEDYVAVELVDGHINYIVNVGDGTVSLRDTSRSHLNDNRWHTVGIRRPSAKQHTLMVDDDIVVATNPGTGNLELDGILYLGGVHKDLYSQLPQAEVKSRHGFEGCIAGLDLNGESPNIMEDAVVHSSLVTAGCEGQSAKCNHNVCANGGLCVQQWHSFTCECDLTTFTGPTCSDESVSYEFGPNRGIITYNFPEDNRPEMQEDSVAVGFMTSKSDAVLLRVVSGSSSDYIEIEIVEGNVFVVYNLGTNDHPLGEISVKVNDNNYHIVRFHRFGHNSTLQIDDYNVQTSHPLGHQLQVFNSQSQIQIGGKWSKGKSRIERPLNGIVSGVVVNGLRVLDLAAEKDSHVSIRGDVQLITGIHDRQDHLQKMQQTPASDFPNLEDDLVFSGAGSGCNGDDEDECPPLPESGSGDDDLITPVYIPPTRPPPTIKTKAPPPSCDDEDCFTGSGGGEVTEDTTNATSASPELTTAQPTASEAATPKPEEQITSTGPVLNLQSSTVTTEKKDEFVPVSTSQVTRETTTVAIVEVETTQTALTTPGRYIEPPSFNQPPYVEHIPQSNNDYYPKQTNKRQERVTSETSEIVALIIGIIAGALIAVILIILVILKFKSRSDRSFKIDDGKGYQQGPNAALLGSQSSTNGNQSQYHLNGALRNGDKQAQFAQKPKKRDSKDIKEWYV